MLTWDVRLEGFDTQDWLSLWTILNPAAGAVRPATDSGGIVAIHERRALRKLLHTRRGAMDRTGHPWPMTAQNLAAMHGARWALVLEHGALDTVMENVADRMRPDDDLLDQVLTAWQVVRELARARKLDVWPGSLRTVPVPTKEIITRAMDLFVPDQHVIVIASWDGPRLQTSMAVRRAGAGFDRVIGPDDLRRELEPAPGDMRAAHRKLCGAIAGRLGAVSLGLSADTAVWATMGAEGEPGRWARLVTAGAVVIEPMPVGVAIPIAVDAGRVAYGTLRSVARRLGAGRRDDPLPGRIPDFDLWTMLRAWAGLGAALRGRRLGAGGDG